MPILLLATTLAMGVLWYTAGTSARSGEPVVLPVAPIVQQPSVPEEPEPPLGPPKSLKKRVSRPEKVQPAPTPPPSPMIPPVQIGELKLPPVEARPAPSKPAHEEPAPVEAKSKPKPKPSGRYTPTERPAPPQNVPAPAPKGPTPARLSPLARPTPVPATEVVLTDLRYDENYEQEQSEMLFDAASRQLEKHLPLLAKCGLDQVYLDVNPKCTTKDHYWQVFSWKYMWITSEGKISANWSSDCVAQYLDGKSMPIGLTHGGQWELKFKILRKFRPNPGGGAMCPYKGLVE